MEPMYYESIYHETAFNQKVKEWHCAADPERFCALYVLLSDPNIRQYQEFLFDDDMKIIDLESEMKEGWMTAADKNVIRVALSLYNGSYCFSVYDLMTDYARYQMEGIRLFLEMNGYIDSYFEKV